MSWGNELLPPKLSARTLWLDLKSAWSAYSEAHLPLRRRAVFLSLRLLQRISYSYGWRRGVNSLKGHGGG